jgi:transposase
MRIVAMDLGKNNSVVCDYDSETGHYTFRTIRTRPQEVHDLLVEKEPDRVVIETGPVSGWVYDLARALGMDICVANTNHAMWRWQANPKKTDRTDALKLAQLTAMGQLPIVHMPSKAVREWRSLIEYRQSLKERRTAIKNSIRSILTREGMVWASGKSGWSASAIKELREMARPLLSVRAGSLWRGQLSIELEQLLSVEEAMAAVTARLDAMGEKSRPVQLLQRVPGVGTRLAEAVVASLDNPHRFRRGKQVGSYAGLTPRQYQSGEQDRKGGISGHGNSTLRSLLVEVSWLMLRWNDWAREMYQRLLKNCGGRKKVAIVAVARRLLVRLWAMWRDGTDWQGTAMITG